MTEIPPSLIGYYPDEAEQTATAHGYTIAWIDSTPPRWLLHATRREARVARQRLRADGVLELLRVWVPKVGTGEE